MCIHIHILFILFNIYYVFVFILIFVQHWSESP